MAAMVEAESKEIQKMIRRKFKYLILSFAFLAIGCASLSQERKAFDHVANEGTTLSCQIFLTDYPKSKLRKEVEERLMDLTFYEKVQSIQTLEAYQKYLSIFPEGRKAKDALAEIENLEFEFYKKVDTLWGYDYFIKRYPNTKYLKEIAERKEFLRYKEVASEGEIDSYEYFLKEFPAGIFSAEIKRRLDIRRQERASFDEISNQDKVEAYNDFIVRYPSSPYIDEAKGRIAVLTTEKIFSDDHRPFFKPVLLSNYTSPITKLHFKNSARSPMTFYFAGKERFYEIFAPGESGTLEFLSGKYRLAIKCTSSPELLWAGEVNFEGKYLLVFDAYLNSFGLIEIGLRPPRYTYYTKSRTGLGLPVQPEILEAYEREIDRLKNIQAEREATSYPLKRVLPSKKMPSLKRPQSREDKFTTLSRLSRLKNPESTRAIIELLGDREIRQSAIDQLRNHNEAIWPLIGLIKQLSEGKGLPSYVDHMFISFYRKRVYQHGDFSIPVGDQDVLGKARNGLAEIKEGVSESIMEAIKYCDKNSQSYLLAALAELSEPRNEDIFLRFLEKETREFKIAAVNGLEHVGTAKSLKALLDVLSGGEDEYLRKNTFKALEEMSKRGKLSLRVTPDIFEDYLKYYDEWPTFFNFISREMIEDSVFLHLNSSDATKRSILCGILSEDPQRMDTQFIAKCLKDSNSEIKVKALKGLAKLKDDNSIEPIAILIEKTSVDYVRKEAIETLGKIGTKKALNRLLDLLKKTKDNREIIRILGETGSPDAAAILIKMPTPFLNDVISEALINMGRSAVPALKNSLNQSDEKMKSFAIYCLERIKDEEATKALLEALNDKSHDIRRKAVEGLYKNEIVSLKREAPYSLISALENRDIPNGEIIEFLGEKGVKQATDAIKDIFGRGIEKGEINYPAITALSLLGERQVLKKAVPLLLDLLKVRNPSEDWRKIKALREIGDERAVPPLLERLNEKGRLGEVIFALSEIGSQKATLPLLRLLNELKEDPNEFVDKKVPSSPHSSSYMIVETDLSKIIEALGKLKDPRAVPPLINILQDERVVRANLFYERIIEALGNIGGKKAEEALLEEFKKIKRAAKGNNLTKISSALLKSQNEAFIDDLCSILKDGDFELKKQVIAVLRKMKSRKAIDALVDVFVSSQDLSWDAAYALADIGEPALNDLFGLMEKTRASQKRPLVIALGNIKNTRAVLPLIKIAPTVGESDLKDSLKKILMANFPELFVPEITLFQVSEKLKSP